MRNLLPENTFVTLSHLYVELQLPFESLFLLRRDRIIADVGVSRSDCKGGADFVVRTCDYVEFEFASDCR